MSEPILIRNELMSDSPLDISGDVDSPGFEIKTAVGYCIMTINAGGAIGIASLEISPDGDEGAGGGTWFDLTGTELAVDGTGNTNVWNVERAMYPFVRVHYVSTSGSGTMTAYISSKSN